MEEIMLKNKFIFLVFVLVICVSVTTVFAKQTKIGKVASNTGKNQILTKTEPQSKDSLNIFSLKESGNPFWTLSKESYLQSNSESEGPAIGFICYKACKSYGWSTATCIALCVLTL
jgi:hypothetical protein